MCQEHTHNHNCGCNNTHTHIDHNICSPCSTTPPPCDCPVADLNTDCSIYRGDDITCNDVIVVAKDTILSDALQDIVDYNCERFSEIQSNFVLKNVGTGAEVYKGTNLIGEKELRTITSTDSSITITEGTNTIDLSVELNGGVSCITSEDSSVTITEDEGCFDLSVTIPEQDVYDGLNLGTGAEVFKNKTANTFNYRKVRSSLGSISITQNSNDINLEMTNLQKTIGAFPYTLTSADDKYTIFIENGVTDVTIYVPDGLVDNFSCIFIQKGTSNVTIEAMGGATLYYPSTTLQNQIKGQFFWAMIEKEIDQDDYYLLGSLKAI